MTEAPCPHECQDESHQYPVIKYASESVVAPQQPLIEMPEPKHEWPPCDGMCPYPSCRKFIQKGMMKAHLMDCHQLEGALASHVIYNPASASMILVEELKRKLDQS